MSKPTLTTDFVRIGQSCPTVDGRTIDAAWLLQAAESYRPDLYTALIWPDHFRFQNYGKVLELKAEEEGGVVALYARLQPNASYLMGNQYGQRLFFSMEIDDNFAGTGRAYLVGLGITDSPASLATSELKFSARRNTPGSQFLSNVECVLPAEAEDREPSWVARLFQLFTPNATQREEPMDAQQYAEMQGKIDALATTVTEIKATVATFTASPAAPAQPAAPVAPAAPAAAPADAPAESMDAKFAAVTDAITKLGAQMDGIAARFEAAKSGTPVPPTEGPADDNAPLL
ncbi:GPO family capsid scaffolding protein [Nitratidesulfovibrio sp. D1]|uniref:GPO family capsid scaffolding protein n=1 Tax=Nitratidesulfovibrio sp. D1 TaxID=3440151 RepID=UPI003EB6C69E